MENNYEVEALKIRIKESESRLKEDRSRLNDITNPAAMRILINNIYPTPKLK